MRKALRRAGPLLLAAGALGLLTPATAHSAPNAVDKPGAAATTAPGRVDEVEVELAWLADRVTFPYPLRARVVGDSLEARGEVPNTAVRDLVLEVARSHCKRPVHDALRVRPGLDRQHTDLTGVLLQQEATGLLVKGMGERARGFGVRAGADGVVVVTGSVGSVEEKLTVSRRLRQLRGCTAIINRLTVTPVVRNGRVLTRVTSDGSRLVENTDAASAEEEESDEEAPTTSPPVVTPSPVGPSPDAAALPRLTDPPASTPVEKDLTPSPVVPSPVVPTPDAATLPRLTVPPAPTAVGKDLLPWWAWPRGEGMSTAPRAPVGREPRAVTLTIPSGLPPMAERPGEDTGSSSEAAGARRGLSRLLPWNWRGRSSSAEAAPPGAQPLPTVSSQPGAPTDAATARVDVLAVPSMPAGWSGVAGGGEKGGRRTPAAPLLQPIPPAKPAVEGPSLEGEAGAQKTAAAGERKPTSGAPAVSPPPASTKTDPGSVALARSPANAPSVWPPAYNVRPAPETAITSGNILVEEGHAATPGAGASRPRAVSAAPVPVIPLVLERIKRQVESACGRGAEVRVEVGPDQLIQVKVKLANSATEKDLTAKIMKIQEIRAPNVALDIDGSHAGSEEKTVASQRSLTRSLSLFPKSPRTPSTTGEGAVSSPLPVSPPPALSPAGRGISGTDSK